MGDTDEAVEVNMRSSLELCSSLLEQLGEALSQLESQKVITCTKVPWKDIEEHFRNLESMMKKKIEELEAKEKEFTEKESHHQVVLAEREATVVAKEQDLLDRVQELKDAAMVAINEAKKTCIPESVEWASVVNANGNKVSSSDDARASLETQEEKPPNKMGEIKEGAAGEAVIPRAELNQFCEQMDSVGLVKFISENLKNLSSRTWKEQLSVVLGSAAEPARLVLNALDEGSFPPKETQEGDNSNAALGGLRKSCLILMEALSAFLSKVDLATDYLNPDIQQEAKSMANNWKLKLSEDSVNAANGNSLEAEGFLRLLATFRIASDFDEEQLCKYILAVSHHRQAIELCRSLDLSQKIPGLVETLIERDRQIDAVHFIHAFELSEAFPPVPLLKEYLKEIRRNSQGNGTPELLTYYNNRELKAVREVIECIEKYKLEDSHPLEPLHRRVHQLDKSSRPSDWKNPYECGKSKNSRTNRDRELRGNRGRDVKRARNGPPPPRTAFGGVQERYIPAVANPYNYPVQPSYAAPASDPRLSYYPQDIRPPGVYPPHASSYGSYYQSSHQPQT